MRIIRFLYKKQVSYGKLEGGTVRILKDGPFPKIELSRSSLPLNKVRLLAPVSPSKIILAGLNYRDHARELKMRIPSEPVVFLKPPSALIAHGENIVYPSGCGRVDYEGELALIIKKISRNIAQHKANEYILGYTCLNDVTARRLQRKDIQWTRAKSFDTFCPLGPWVETSFDPSAADIKTCLNGKIKQASNTRNFIFPVPYLVSFISRIMTLYPGDVISTGTPFGVGRLKPGDKVEVYIEGVGRLTNRVSYGR
ncbi:MAG: fumarylacetoacetate hydrolase family protein [Candidatus Omnitrophota bacterium]